MPNRKAAFAAGFAHRYQVGYLLPGQFFAAQYFAPHAQRWPLTPHWPAGQ
jgi:hypothetical protein